MLGRKKQSFGGRMAESVAAVGARAQDRLPGTLDRYAAGALVLGMGNWLTTSLFNFDAVHAVAGKRSISGRTLYGLIGLSAVYATARGARKAA